MKLRERLKLWYENYLINRGISRIYDAHRGRENPIGAAVDELMIRTWLEELRDYLSDNWRKDPTLESLKKEWLDDKVKPLRAHSPERVKLTYKLVAQMEEDELLHPAEYKQWLQFAVGEIGKPIEVLKANKYMRRVLMS